MSDYQRGSRINNSYSYIKLKALNKIIIILWHSKDFVKNVTIKIVIYLFIFYFWHKKHLSLKQIKINTNSASLMNEHSMYCNYDGSVNYNINIINLFGLQMLCINFSSHLWSTQLNELENLYILVIFFLYMMYF